MAEERRPWILLIRSALFSTAAPYLEKALFRRCNVVTFYVDGTSIFYLAGTYFGKVSRWLSTHLAKVFISRRLRFIGVKNVDAILVVDPVRIPFDFSYEGAKTAYYALDPHVCSREHIERLRLSKYDVVFAAQKDHIRRYEEEGCQRVLWLPPAADPEIHKPINTQRIFDLCFIGHFDSPVRRKFLKEVEEKLGNSNLFFGTAFMHDMVYKYSQSHIILNKSIVGDMNMRIFEAMSCGRMLLTDRIGNGLQDLFQDRRHLVTYSDLNELLDLFHYYLTKVDEREAIASEGKTKVWKEHTYDCRVDFILRSMGLSYR